MNKNKNELFFFADFYMIGSIEYVLCINFMGNLKFKLDCKIFILTQIQIESWIWFILTQYLIESEIS